MFSFVLVGYFERFERARAGRGDIRTRYSFLNILAADPVLDSLLFVLFSLPYLLALEVDVLGDQAGAEGLTEQSRVLSLAL